LSAVCKGHKYKNSRQAAVGKEYYVIELTKLRGDKFMLNCDLIEMVEENPDTTILLTNGRYLIVQESMKEITEKVIMFRRKIYERSRGDKEFQ